MRFSLALRAVLLPAFFAIVGCATKNDSGVVLYKKPDLSKVAPGTPVSKVAGLKKPIKREVITKGELKGAEAWLYEWDAPNDEVNNKMFTSVVVKDGIITGFYEETPEKWRKDPEMLKQAKLQSAFEDLASSMAQAAQYQAAAGFAAAYGAQMANRAASAPMQAYNNAYTSSYKPWENAQPANFGMVGGSPIAFGGQQESTNLRSLCCRVLPRQRLRLRNRHGVNGWRRVAGVNRRGGRQVKPTVAAELANNRGVSDLCCHRGPASCSAEPTDNRCVSNLCCHRRSAATASHLGDNR
jgi:hypothetical protein